MTFAHTPPTFDADGATALTPRPFSITSEVPRGTTMIEASAGTGKTWTLAALVTRFVARDGLDVSDLLVVTFSRAATQELRERVRSQLEFALHRLEPQAPPQPSDDALITQLRSADVETQAVYRARLQRALATFDSATIATIHQFCHHVLKGLGIAGNSDPYATLTDAVTPLQEQVIDDLYLAMRRNDPSFSLSYEVARTIGRRTLANASVPLSPANPEPSLIHQITFAQAVRDEYQRRKRRAGILEYDDLLTQLRDAVTAGSPQEPSAAVRRMRETWKVVLVDEFQDTDPVQWTIFHTAFGHSDGTLILVGDPKQAIYAFRGGDIHTYLRARREAQTLYTLPVNYRSDGQLVRSLQQFLGNVELSDEVLVRPITAARAETSRITEVGDSPLEMRWWAERPTAVGQARSVLYRDVARRASQLLHSSAQYDGRALRTSDIAVLCHQRSDLVNIRAELEAVGIPAVMMSSESVLRTLAGRWWMQLLMALEQPHRAERVRAACLTPLIGWDVDQVEHAAHGGVDESVELIHSLRSTFERGGVAAVATALRSRGLAARLLATLNGERDLTDVEHCAQLLATRQVEATAGIASLTAWLADQMAQDARVTPDTRIMRLDSDSQAVTLATIHSSKGLQYPIVFAPTLWDRASRQEYPPQVVAGPMGRELSFSLDAVDAPQHKADVAAETMRMAYVAMTRAQSHLVLWWMPTKRNTAKGPLTRLLCGQGSETDVAQLLQARASGELTAPVVTQEQHGCRQPDQMSTLLRAWSTGDAAPFCVHEIDPAEPVESFTPPVHDTPLRDRRFAASLVDTTWRRTSYSALSAAGEAADLERAQASGGMLDVDGPNTSEPDDEWHLNADPDGLLTPTPSDESLAEPSVTSPMANAPMGATFGSLVHAALEFADFQASDLHAEFLRVLRENIALWPVETSLDELAAALVAVCQTPLGPLVGDVRLRDITAEDRAPEMEFEVPLAGGDHPHAEPTLRDFVTWLRRLPESDPLRPYADVLVTSAVGEQPLRGYLTGSIDLTFRHDGRYYVVDYKTNWLGDPEAPLDMAAYRPSALAAAMNHSSYPLQAILYSVVLHRYLRWRLPGYDPETHLGGVMYLYVRGMAGAETPRENTIPYGVFWWQPPSEIVTRLSDVLAGYAVGETSAPDEVGLL